MAFLTSRYFDPPILRNNNRLILQRFHVKFRVVDVLPLILNHFQKQYADQKWRIYDVKRQHGLYYDLIDTEQLAFENPIVSSTNKSDMVLDEDEFLYEQLWKDYFTGTNIPSRKNMKLHKRHLPMRYWKCLSDKLPQ